MLYYIVPLIFLVACCHKPGPQKTPPGIVNGVLDVKNWNFKEDGPFEIKGEWKFKWMENNPEFIRERVCLATTHYLQCRR